MLHFRSCTCKGHWTQRLSDTLDLFSSDVPPHIRFRYAYEKNARPGTQYTQFIILQADHRVRITHESKRARRLPQAGTQDEAEGEFETTQRWARRGRTFAFRSQHTHAGTGSDVD